MNSTLETMSHITMILTPPPNEMKREEEEPSPPLERDLYNREIPKYKKKISFTAQKSILCV